MISLQVILVSPLPFAGAEFLIEHFHDVRIPQLKRNITHSREGGDTVVQLGFDPLKSVYREEHQYDFDFDVNAMALKVVVLWVRVAEDRNSVFPPCSTIGQENPKSSSGWARANAGTASAAE